MQEQWETKAKIIDGRVWLNAKEFSGKCHVQDFVLPNQPLENVTEEVCMKSKFFPPLINFNESKWVNSMIFSYLESLKNIVKYNSRGYLCHV